MNAKGEGGLFFESQIKQTLSQGDLIKDVPWGVVPDPLLLCRPASTGPGRQPAEWSTAKNPFKAMEEVHLPAKTSLAVVLWDDCQIDKAMNQGRKKEQWFASIAPVLPAKLLQNGAKAMMEGRSRRFFPLPKDDQAGLSEDSYADLRHIIPVKYSLLESRRVASITPVAKQMLVGHLFAFLTSKQLPDKCSKCGAAAEFVSLGDD